MWPFGDKVSQHGLTYQITGKDPEPKSMIGTNLDAAITPTSEGMGPSVEQKKPRGAGSASVGPRLGMVTAIHGAPEDVHGVVSMLHNPQQENAPHPQTEGLESTAGSFQGVQQGQAQQTHQPTPGTEGPAGPFQMPNVAPKSGTLMDQTTGKTWSATNPPSKVNNFTPPTMGGERGTSRGGESMGSRFGGVLNDQGGRIGSLLANQAGDAASIRAEKAANAPMEREHMSHMWADEDTQRHQQMTAMQLENDRKGWEFKREQQFEGQHPQLVHIMGLKQHMLENPEGPMGVGADGKPNGTRSLSPAQQAFMGELDRMAQGLQAAGMGGTPAVTPQDNTAPKKVEEKSSGWSNVGNSLRAGVEGAIPAAATAGVGRLGAQWLAKTALGRIPYVGPAASYLGGALLGGGAGALTGGVEHEIDPGMFENMAGHPTSAGMGNIIGGLLGFRGVKPKGMTAKVTPTAEQSSGLDTHARVRGEAAVKAPTPPPKPPGGKFQSKDWYQQQGLQPSPAPTGALGERSVKAPTLGSRLATGVEEKGKPLQQVVPENANGPGTSSGTNQKLGANGWPNGTGSWTKPQKGAGNSFGQALPQNQGIPAMITKEMERKLSLMGMSPQDINRLTPQQAWDLILRGTK